ncbi:hypothetical protein JCM9534A_17930 [Catenuloplanes indicus JCM 9534]
MGSTTAILDPGPAGAAEEVIILMADAVETATARAGGVRQSAAGQPSPRTTTA